MFKKRKGWLVVTLLIAFFPFTLGNATEVQQVQTNGTIGFTGVYEPIGTPDPTPPESIVRPPIREVAKPGGILPQSNELERSWLNWLGISMISFAFLLWKQKKKQNTKLKQ